MTSLNRPDKFTLDAFSDPNLESNLNGYYNRFTNQLRTPILNAKGIQLLNANFINSILQLNDNSHLMFFYYQSSTQAGIRTLANLRCVRLLPSSYVPVAGYTTFTKNKYFNNVSELVVALNQAASTGGDDITYNPDFLVNSIQFVYDITTRAISVTIGSAGGFIAPAAADDANVLDVLRGTTSAGSRIRMNQFGNTSGYAGALLQPYVEGVSMNARLGFAMGFNTRGLFWTASSQQGCATSTGIPAGTGVTTQADSPPILLGSQNCSIYLSIAGGSGIDFTGRKNMIQAVPIEVAPYNINSFHASSIDKPALSIPQEIYEISVEMLDDNGQPFVQYANFNTNLSFAVYY